MPAARRLENWIASYIEYTEKQESPEKLHFWVGISLLSAALKRQVWMDRGYYKLYPNVYVLLVDESGQARKSTAVDIGIKLIRDAVPDLYYISGSMTPEGLIKHMNRVKVVVNDSKKTVQYDSHVLIHADELAELFGFDRQRASRLTILLTKIYGAQAEHTHTLASEGQLSLRNLYPTLLAATDPRNLKVLPDEAVAGLLGRLLFVTAGGKRAPVAWPKPTEVETELYKKLKIDLYGISQLRGEAHVSGEARECFEEWYIKKSSMKVEDTRLAAFNERCHDTALKLAILTSISDNNDLKLTHIHMEKSIIQIETQIPEFSKVMNWITSSPYAQARAKFIDTLRRQGGVGTRRAMLKSMTISLEEISSLEASLEQEGTVESKIHGKTILYRLAKEEKDG